MVLLTAVCLINSGHLASASTSKIHTNLKEYLSTYDISFLIRSDLNNDGKEEKVTLYRQWDGEDPGWSDDQWYIIRVFIVSLEQAQCWDAQTQVYGWEEGSYRFMGEVEG